MSILIKGMEMPRNCDDCRLDIDCAYDESQDGYKMMGGRPRKCPLVPVPPHGRLIDADANLAVMMRVLDAPNISHGTIDTAMLKACIKMFEEAPTIVPAEEGE